MESPEKAPISRKVYFATILMLLLINCGSLYLLYSASVDKTDVTIQKSALEQDFKKLSDTLTVKKNELQQFVGKNEALDKTIAADQAMIDKEKNEIAGLLHKNKLTASELAKAKGMIAMYESSIAEMTRQIGDLTTQNQELANTNHDLMHHLDAERVTTAQLSDQNKTLTKKVEAGSLLQLSKIDVEAIRKKHNGKKVQVKRVKAAEELKISFETGGNKVLDPGPVSLYVRIINPKGETIAVSDQGSGTIQTADSPNPVQYSKKADIVWDQTNKKVTVYWSQNISEPGTYKVEVYQRGYIVGEGEVKLI